VTDTEARYRLPRTVTPSHYDLTVAPDLEAATFTGSEAVTVTVHEPVTEIVVNAKELHVAGGGRLEGPGGASVEIAKVVPDAEAERVRLELAEEAAAGSWTLHLTFSGTLNDKMVGFYRSLYRDDDGHERTIATTHFEATDARMCFPCWDEPDLKASFGVILEVADDLLALSNGPEIAREPLDDGRVRVRFADTMVMSTYLVCFVVGPLVLSEVRDARGTPVRVVCRPGREHLAAFALDVSVFSLEWFGDYYAIPYPDAKLDNAAIPDFAQGAMENLGLVTYREQLLLLDPAAASLDERLDVAETVAHELAHMWFGDLVTMRWWNGIWLNEAFATFMSYLCVDAMRPEWRVFDAFSRIRSNAFEVDALESTRTIEYPVASPDDASGMFDTLTYTKGGACLRMLEQWLGPDVFRDGIRRYLAAHAHGNTETHDLWDAIEKATGEPVRRIMDGWIWQGGYPLVSAQLRDGTVELGQRRYLISGKQDDTVWDVPLLVRTSAGTEPVLIEPGGVSIPVADDGPVVVNAGVHAFVRVEYDDELLARLTADLRSLSTDERTQLVDDTWASVVAGHRSAVEFCRFAGSFAEETELPVWQSLLQGLSWCERFLTSGPREHFRSWVLGLLWPAIERIGWEPREGERDLDKPLRGALMAALGILGADPQAFGLAMEIERESRGDGRVDPSLAAASVAIVAAGGTSEDYERYLEAIAKARTPQEELRYLYALPDFRDASLVGRTLEMTLTGKIRSQNVPGVLARAMANRDHGDRAWAFAKEHWDEIVSRLAPTTVVYAADGTRFLTEPDQVDDAAAFFAAHPIPQSALQLQQILERQRVNEAFRRRATPELMAAFSAGPELGEPG
jgi:puromycin-sensitive aminopeptidase